MSTTAKEIRRARRRVEKDLQSAIRAASATASATDLQGEADNDWASQRLADLERRAKTLRKLEKRQARIERVREPDVYGPQSRHSWLRDQLAVRSTRIMPGVDPAEARDRLDKHARSADARRVVHNDLAHRAATRGGYVIADGGTQATGSVLVETRALSTTSGFGGEFTPPAYLESLWVSEARGASPTLKLADVQPVPDTGLEVFVPRITYASASGTQSEGVGEQGGGQNMPAPAVFDSPNAADFLSSPVVMLTGSVLLSQQLLDRGWNIDQVVAREASKQYAAAFEQKLLAGVGGNDILGVLNLPTAATDTVPGSIAVSYTSSTPTPAGLVGAIGQAIGQSADGRRLLPEAILMRGARWAWVATTVDSESEPVVRPGTGLLPKAGSGPLGPIAGLPVYTADAIPLSSGEDFVITYRPSDLIVLAGQPKLEVWDEGMSAASLSAVVNWRIYVAAITGAYPSGVAVISGSGLTVQAGF